MNRLIKLIKKDEVVSVTYFQHRRYRLVHSPLAPAKNPKLFTGEWNWVYDNGDRAHQVPYYSQEAAMWGFGEWMNTSSVGPG